MNMSQYNGFEVSTMDVDSLMRYHQGTSSYNVDYASMHFMETCVFGLKKHLAPH